jgi:hypothetical protein
VLTVAELPAFVNVTVGDDTLELLNPVDGDHKYVLLATDELPKLEFDPEQNVTSLPALAVGGVILDVTTTLSVTVHPFVVFETNNV